MKPGKLVQIFFFCFLKKNKIEAKMPRFQSRQTDPGPGAQRRSHAPEHSVSSSLRTEGLVSPHHVARNQQPGCGWCLCAPVWEEGLEGG